ncbi:MAG: PQQ-binding-like beta-propeller repeat protein [Bacteroidota bacterium]
MRSLLFICLAIGLALPLIAQVVEPIAETTVPENGKKIFLHSTTGIPVLQTNKGYLGLNPVDGSIIWELDRNAGAAFTESTDAEGENRDFDEIAGTPFVFAAGNLINVTNGDLLIDGSAQDLRILRTYYFLPDVDLILLEIGGKGAVYLYAINPFEGETKWNVQLRELSGLGQLMSEDNAGQDDDELQPQLNAAGHLIYPNDKYLALVDLSSGELKWNEKFNAGYIFTNAAGDRMVIAEKRGGLGGLTGGLGSGPQKFSKKVHLIDTETGESITRKEIKMDGNVLYVTPFDGGFLVVHDDGMNIFDYSTGENRWRKDYKMNGLRNVEITDEGLMTYTRNKRMLVDPATGEGVWRREERLEREPRGFLWATSSADEIVPEQIGNHQINMYNGYFEVVDGERYYYRWILVEEDRIAFVNPVPAERQASIGRPQYILSVLDLSGNSPEIAREQFGIKKGLAAFDKTENGYFLFNDRGFVLLDYRNGEFTEVKDEWYPDPTATTRFLVGAATAVGSTAYAVSESQRMVTNTAVNGDAGAIDRYQNRMNTLNEVSGAGVDYSTDRQINGQVDAAFAFFFSRDGSEGLTLFKIDKNTGEEVSKFRFDDRTPLYEIDYLNNRIYYQADLKFKVYRLN